MLSIFTYPTSSAAWWLFQSRPQWSFCIESETIHFSFRVCIESFSVAAQPTAGNTYEQQEGVVRGQLSVGVVLMHQGYLVHFKAFFFHDDIGIGDLRNFVLDWEMLRSHNPNISRLFWLWCGQVWPSDFRFMEMCPVNILDITWVISQQ